MSYKKTIYKYLKNIFLSPVINFDYNESIRSINLEKKNKDIGSGYIYLINWIPDSGFIPSNIALGILFIDESKKYSLYRFIDNSAYDKLINKYGDKIGLHIKTVIDSVDNYIIEKSYENYDKVLCNTINYEIVSLYKVKEKNIIKELDILKEKYL